MLSRIGFALSALLCIVFLCATPVSAYPRYYNDAEDPGSNCSQCHGAFTDSTSPTGASIPMGKHELHRSSSYMNTECNLCHTVGDSRNPYTNSSNGTNDNVGYGCSGCHGRLEDAGNDANSTGYGAGLRQHHWRSGIQTCGMANCHTDADPAAYTPVPESVDPPYYNTVDTLAKLPCNPDAVADTNENWSVGDFEGLDNDGDNVYDTLDPDCAPPGSPGETLNLRVTNHDPAANSLDLTVDIPCSASDQTLHYGTLPLTGPPLYPYTGVDCTIDNSGSHTWSFPGGTLFFLVVSNDGTREGSYGKDYQNNERSANLTFNTVCPQPQPQDLASRCD
jgi:hypothetical protein